MSDNLESLKIVDELMGSSDYDDLQEFVKAQRHVMSFIDPAQLVERTSAIIEESECIHFSSKRAKNFIDPTRPVFKLHILQAKSEELYPDSAKESYTDDEIISFRSNVVYEEIIRPFSETIRNAFKTDEDNLLTDRPDDSRLLEFILTNIFGISATVDRGDKTLCTVQYII